MMLNCSENLTNSQFQVYSPFALSGICLLSLCISIPGVGVGIHEFCIKNKVSDLRTERLLLYLACIASICSLLGSFQWLAYFASFDYHRFADIGCSLLAYLWFTVSISLLIITVCIGIHFLLQILQPRVLNVLREEKIQRYKKLEYAYLFSSVVLACVISPWPLLENGFGYNLWICWINVFNKDCTSLVPISSFFSMLFYSAILFGFMYTFVVVIIVQIMICRRKRNKQNLYISAFISYLGITMVLFGTLMLLTIIQQSSEVMSVINGVVCTSSGFLPLAASIVTTKAFLYKKFGGKRVHISQATPTQHYRSFEDTITFHRDTTRSPTTTWISPPTTGITNSSLVSKHP